MKKFLCFLLCLVFGLSLAGCDSSDATTDNSLTFTKGGVTITLEKDWSELDNPYVTVAYQSKKAGFMANTENASDYVGFTFFEDKENPSAYGDFVLSANSAKLDGEDAPACVNDKTNAGAYFAYSTYDNVANGIAARYLLVVMYGKEKMYCMNFFATKSEFAGLKDKFLSYAKTIVVE